MFYVGVDLGKTRDHTAIAVVTYTTTGYGPNVNKYLDVRGLERVPLGTPYPEVVERLERLVRGLGACCLVVDATGVGAPVVDSIRRSRVGCEVCAVTITGGEQASSGMMGNRWNVPKQDLLSGLQVLLEGGELRIASRLKEADRLARELMDVTVTPRPSGKMRMGADGCGQHDDLVIALALGCWRAKRPMNSFGGEGRLLSH
jgi:hypothetical protein